ncbi:MAG: hypothetical protein K8R21_05160, partial [Leptospira sp.]|nr:hypothetical protein [Leptospira sp.]
MKQLKSHLKFSALVVIAIVAGLLLSNQLGFHVDVSVLGKFLFDGLFGHSDGLRIAAPIAAATLTKTKLRIKKSDIKEIKLDADMYKTAKNEELSFSEFIEKAELAAGFDPGESDAGKLSPLERQFL